MEHSTIIYLICVAKYSIQILSYNAFHLVLHLVPLLNVHCTVRRCMILSFQLCIEGINLQYKDIMADYHLNLCSSNFESHVAVDC